ncbi:MAG: hypothetical protein HYR67_19080 [Bacteroidetes bacterium]|nr:hypothetical protein [Bacteroidota bacterium]
MKKPLNFVRIVGLVALIVALVFACHEDQNLLLNQKVKQSAQAAVDNSQMIATAQDVVNVTASAFANQGITFGRVADGHDDDDEFECKPSIINNIKIDRSHPDSLIISGTITIDFDSAICGDSAEVRKGKIIDSLMLVIVIKDKSVFKSFEKITFQNYWKDSVNVNGIISVSAATGSPTVVKVNGTKIKYHDGSSSSWSGDLVFTYQRSGVGNTYSSTMTLTGSWSGTTRSGTNFTANITKEIDFKAGCFGHRHKFIPVSGTVVITANGVVSTIDYGDGTCDRIYTITTAGATTEHHLG